MAAGGDAVSQSGSSSFSIGQIVYHFSRAELFSSNEGLQQPFEIIALSTEKFVSNSNITIYPNPVFSGFFIEIPPTFTGTSDYFISDTSGKIFYIGNLTTQKTFIEVSKLTRGIYLINVGNNGSNSAFKIIKN